MKTRPPQPLPKFLVCDFLNGFGNCVERIFICMVEGSDATERLRSGVLDGDISLVLDVMAAEANIIGSPTSIDDAALAINALFNEVAANRSPLGPARTIIAVSVDFRKAVKIEEVLPVLEEAFGGNAVLWARGVFRPLGLGSPFLN